MSCIIANITKSGLDNLHERRKTGCRIGCSHLRANACMYDVGGSRDQMRLLCEAKIKISLLILFIEEKLQDGF